MNTRQEHPMTSEHCPCCKARYRGRPGFYSLSTSEAYCFSCGEATPKRQWIIAATEEQMIAATPFVEQRYLH